MKMVLITQANSEGLAEPANLRSRPQCLCCSLTHYRELEEASDKEYKNL